MSQSPISPIANAALAPLGAQQTLQLPQDDVLFQRMGDWAFVDFTPSLGNAHLESLGRFAIAPLDFMVMQDIEADFLATTLPPVAQHYDSLLKETFTHTAQLPSWDAANAILQADLDLRSALQVGRLQGSLL